MARDLQQRSVCTAVGVGVALTTGEAPFVLVVCPSSHLSREALVDLGRSQACHLAMMNLSKVLDDGHRQAKLGGAETSRRRCPTKRATEHAVGWKASHDGPEPSRPGQAFYGQSGVKLALPPTLAIPFRFAMPNQEHQLELVYLSLPIVPPHHIDKGIEK